MGRRVFSNGNRLFVNGNTLFSNGKPLFSNGNGHSQTGNLYFQTGAGFPFTNRKKQSLSSGSDRLFPNGRDRESPENKGFFCNRKRQPCIKVGVYGWCGRRDLNLKNAVFSCIFVFLYVRKTLIFQWYLDFLS